MNTVEGNDSYHFILSRALEIAGDIGTLSKAIHVSVPAIYAWRNGRRKPNRSNLESILKYIQHSRPYEYNKNVSSRGINFADSKQNNVHEIVHKNIHIESSFALIPLLDMNLDETGETFAFRETWLSKISQGRNDMLFLYKYMGVNMMPLFLSDSVLLINTANRTLIDGKIYIFMLDGNIYIRRFFTLPSKLLFRVENREFELQDIVITDTKKIVVVGEVVWVCREL